MPITAICVDPGTVRPYLQGMAQGLSQDVSELGPAAADRRPVWPLIVAAGVIGGLAALAGGLWLHYGTTVFFETVRAGIAACF